MPSDTTELLNQMLQNFQVVFKDAGDKMCDLSWKCVDTHFPYDSIGYVRRGEIELCVNGETEQVRAGGLYYIPAMSCFSHHVIGETADVYWTHFEFGAGGRSITQRFEFPVSISRCEAVESIYEAMFQSMRSARLGAPFELTGLMYRLAAFFLGRCQEKLRLRNSGQFERMGRVTQYIDDNMDQELTVEVLAAQAGLSPSYFAQAFQRFFHQPPIQFVLQQREQAARTMLECSQLSVKQIALSLGFSNQNYFSEFFKKRSGCSPSEYRKLKGVQTGSE